MTASLRPGSQGLDTALETVSAGLPIVVENPASTGVPAFVVVPAGRVTAAILTRIDRYGFGQGYLALSAERCAVLGLRRISRHRVGDQAKLVESIDARTGIGVGLSAEDRAHTIRLAASEAAGPSDFVHPGHVLALAAEPDGTLRRPGATEAAVDLIRLADAGATAVMWPVLASDGSLPDRVAIEQFCMFAALDRVTVEEIVARRWRDGDAIEPITRAALPTAWGMFEAIGYRERVSGDQHLVLVHGAVDGAQDVLTSLHEECVLGTALRANHCSCRPRLEYALARTGEALGVVIYSQVKGADVRRPFTICGAGEGAMPSPRSLVVDHVLTDLGVRSVRWLGERPAMRPAPGTAARSR